jgi:hypothetical protein
MTGPHQTEVPSRSATCRANPTHTAHEGTPRGRHHIISRAARNRAIAGEALGILVQLLQLGAIELRDP